jgi:hypothetical protein
VPFVGFAAIGSLPCYAFRVTLTTVRYVRTENVEQRVELDLAEFQALLDAASIAEHGLPDVKALISELKLADAAHRTG